MNRHFFKFLSLLLFATFAHLALAEKLTIAAAAQLKFAMDEVVTRFNQAHPDHQVIVVYGASGKLLAQIQQGAPYDLYFSADMDHPRELYDKGFAASEVILYAYGRIVVWIGIPDSAPLTLTDLTNPAIKRIAVANPKHAPYGQRAEEALRAAGVLDQVQAKLVFGENIAHAVQFVQTGNAQAGIIALALVKSPQLAKSGQAWLIPEEMHQPLAQGFIITKRAQHRQLAMTFAEFMKSDTAVSILHAYGYVLPVDDQSCAKGDQAMCP